MPIAPMGARDDDTQVANEVEGRPAVALKTA